MPEPFFGGTRPDGVTLRVRDAGAVAAFYREVLGLSPGADDDGFRLILDPAPGAPPRPRPSVGLYHFALLYSDRASLAAAVRRILDAGWSRVDGASDHGVSEAFYLRDPEENGIELYRDRPPDAWPREGDEVAMVTERLDLDGLLADAPAGSEKGAPSPRLGHLHLHAGDLEESGRFYTEVLGLEVRQSGYAGALFLGAGGYHHHLGLNAWARGRRAQEGAAGLIRAGWRTGSAELERIRARARARGAAVREEDGAIVLQDPDGLALAVRADDGG